jgi:hypothetical protein
MNRLTKKETEITVMVPGVSFKMRITAPSVSILVLVKAGRLPRLCRLVDVLQVSRESNSMDAKKYCFGDGLSLRFFSTFPNSFLGTGNAI